jgi:hypothetical protein
MDGERLKAMFRYKDTHQRPILGRNPDKSLQSFPSCYSKSPPQLCLEILQTHATSYSFYSALLYTVKEKGGEA